MRRVHKHRRPTTCNCSIEALEPKDTCPIHGAGDWPPRCEECGQLLKWPKVAAVEECEVNGCTGAGVHWHGGSPP
jgi:hypothetical protein